MLIQPGLGKFQNTVPDSPYSPYMFVPVRVDDFHMVEEAVTDSANQLIDLLGSHTNDKRDVEALANSLHQSLTLSGADSEQVLGLMNACNANHFAVNKFYTLLQGIVGEKKQIVAERISRMVENFIADTNSFKDITKFISKFNPNPNKSSIGELYSGLHEVRNNTINLMRYIGNVAFEIFEKKSPNAHMQSIAVH